MTPGIHAYLLVSVVMFGLGVLGFLIRRNVLVLLMCIELMLNAVNLALVAFSRMHGAVDGQVMAALVMVVAASEAAVGLALLVLLFRRFDTLDREDLVLLGESSAGDESEAVSPPSSPVAKES